MDRGLYRPLQRGLCFSTLGGRGLGGKNDRSCETAPPAVRRCGICVGPGDARRRGRAQSRGARLQTARPDQMESTQRRRLAKRGARGRPVEAWVLRRAQHVAQGRPFQPAALPSQRPLHHRAERDVVDGQWAGAKAEDASLLIVGDGPGTSTEVEATSGRFTALNPAAVAYTLPDQYKWRDPTGAAGTNQVVLHGDPTKSELYVVLNRFKPGNFSKPNFHPTDRFLTVVKGTWWVATGNKADKDNMVPMPSGSFVTHFGKQVHWDGAKDEEAWVLIVGEGPGTLTLVEEAK